MRRFIHTLLIACCMAASMVAMAQTTATVDGITYEFITKAKLATVVASESGSYSGNIVIPETVEHNGVVCSVTKIRDNAFHDCNRLKSVIIPNSVTTIGQGAFEGCSSLTRIVVESGNTRYDSREGCNAIIETATNTLVTGCKNTVIPESVTTIGYRAFNDCTGLTSITIPNSVTKIGIAAFFYCI